jgi:hypothetical protein
MAAAAALYDETGTAEACIEKAEQLANVHAAECAIASNRLRQGAALAVIHGTVRGFDTADAPLVAATDASYKQRHGGLAYVISDGRWGVRSRPAHRLDPTGPSHALVNELRAVELLLTQVGDPGRPLAVLVDSTAALVYLHTWQSGLVAKMPTGYIVAPRSTGEPTLVRLATLLPRLAMVEFHHVKGHCGHLLNEAADSLAAMARRRCTQHVDLRDRADSLVASFLTNWHANRAASVLTCGR